MNIKRAIFLFLIIIWTGFSFFAVCYNTVKALSEYREWGNLSDGQKREKLFGDLYGFYLLLDSHTPKNAQILLYSPDVMTFYLERYYLYPKTLMFTRDKSQFLTLVKSKKYKYVAEYDATTPLGGYEKIASLPKDVKHVGGIYKKR